MKSLFKPVDDILRGDATRITKLGDGEIRTSVRSLMLAIVLLSMAYGACMGSYTVIQSGGTHWMQLIASVVKLPALFFLTLIVTLPSLYVFNALVGSRLTFRSVLRLLTAMLAVVVAVTASLGPIVVVFSASTDSYSFMKLLNVLFCAVGGFCGLWFLLRTLHRLVLAGMAYRRQTRVQETPPKQADQAVTSQSPQQPTEQGDDATANQPTNAGESMAYDVQSPQDIASAPPGVPVQVEAQQDPDDDSTPLDMVGGEVTDARAMKVFRIWVVLFGIVGAQLSWILRPFIGNPDDTFSWFRPRSGDFFSNLLDTLAHLLGG